MCVEADCGAAPVFVLLSSESPGVREEIGSRVPTVVFPGDDDELIGVDDRVVDGGRIVRVRRVDVTSDQLALVDISWEASRFEGRGTTLVYQHDGETWSRVDPETVGVTVTTSVP